ncbi:MAG: EamA family transporter RarD [Ilumatobacteraceae bacterium]
MTDETSRGVRAGIAAYTIWGLLTVYWKQLEDFDPFELVGWRIACAAVVMAVIMTATRSWPPLVAALRDRTTSSRLLLAALLLAANWTSYVWAVSNDHVIETALGYFMAPLGTMVIGVVVLHERTSRLHLVAIALAALAVVVLTMSYGRPPYVALVMASTWSLYGLLKRRVALTGIESLAGETFLLTIPAIVVILVMATRDGSIPSSATDRDWVLVLLTGLVTAVPLMLFAVAAQRVPFGLLGPLQYIVPTINLVLGWFVYGETMPADRLVGFALVWAALVAITVDRVRSTRHDRLVDAGLTPTARG